MIRLSVSLFWRGKATSRECLVVTGQDMDWTKADPDYLPREVDASRPSIARVYDAVLGGKDNFAADRAVVAEVQKTFPDGGGAARVNRALLGRAVRYMAQAAPVSSLTLDPAFRLCRIRIRSPRR
jgi:S-adenosyl methyltransferase